MIVVIIFLIFMAVIIIVLAHIQNDYLSKMDKDKPIISTSSSIILGLCSISAADTPTKEYVMSTFAPPVFDLPKYGAASITNLPDPQIENRIDNSLPQLWEVDGEFKDYYLYILYPDGTVEYFRDCIRCEWFISALKPEHIRCQGTFISYT